MGVMRVTFITDPKDQKKAFRSVLSDLGYLEKMIESGKLDRNTTRIGAEQELYLIDNACNPAPLIKEFLEIINDLHFTYELARFNLEINFDPLIFEGDCLSQLKNDLIRFMDKANKNAAKLGSIQVFMAGILPTIRKLDLELDNLTPNERARAMIEAMNWLKKKDYTIQINGIDELSTTDFSNMFQSCNTSFQLHYQVNKAKDFPDYFNFAQAIAGPVLAACTNSPLLFGKKLWHETRIALFQQSVDTRNITYHLSKTHLRVPFGDKWVKNSIVEVFEDDLSRFKPFLCYTDPDDTKRSWEQGEIPKLWNLNVFNGSVFRWIRPCYGVLDGQPHLRIENRLLPSGPSISDEVANAAFWTGLMHGLPDRYRGIAAKMNFEDSKLNLLKAARYGLGTQFKWLDGKKVTAEELILDELLPIARAGLKKANVNKEDINEYLAIIENRIATGRTGSQWMLDAWMELSDIESNDDKAYAVTVAMLNRQKQGKPVHEWSLPSSSEINFDDKVYDLVGKFMTTDLYSVREDDLLDQVAFNMIKNNYHYVLVADEDGNLKGVVTVNKLLEELITKEKRNGAEGLMVKDAMLSHPVTVLPSTPLVKAIQLMKEHKVKYLPVTFKNKLAGIITEFDILKIAEFFIKKHQSDD